MVLQWKWLRGNLDDELDAKTFAAFRIDVDGRTITQLYDRVAEGERDYVKVPLYPLALGVAEKWWRLLYEPRKSNENRDTVAAHHYLDAYLPGFVFPPVSLWSGGDNALALESASVQSEHSTFQFLHSDLPAMVIARDDLEGDLFRLVQAAIERIGECPLGRDLRQSWDRVLSSLGDEDERKYCKAAGRLGVDPYDPDAEDISIFTKGLSEHLFSDICEAAHPVEIRAATDWARESALHLGELPELGVCLLGDSRLPAPTEKVWHHGYETARAMRRKIGLEGLRPRAVVDKLFGVMVRADGKIIDGESPPAIEAIANRKNGHMRVALPKTSARMRRFRLCRALYLASRTTNEDSSAVTTATTLSQQASRAFAAELLAPADLLRELASQSGLTSDKIEKFASESVCPEATVIWQAHNHNIPLRGVGLPETAQ
jgi:hypothetical protein